MAIRDNAKTSNANELLASAAMLWRGNQLGLLEIRQSPGPAIPRVTMKELLGAAVREGLWKPEVRGERKP